MARKFNLSDFSRFAGSPGMTMGDSGTTIGSDPAGFGYSGNEYGPLSRFGTEGGLARLLGNDKVQFEFDPQTGQLIAFRENLGDNKGREYGFTTQGDEYVPDAGRDIQWNIKESGLANFMDKYGPALPGLGAGITGLLSGAGGAAAGVGGATEPVASLSLGGAVDPWASILAAGDTPLAEAAASYGASGAVPFADSVKNIGLLNTLGNTVSNAFTGTNAAGTGTGLLNSLGSGVGSAAGNLLGSSTAKWLLPLLGAGASYFDTKNQPKNTGNPEAVEAIRQLRAGGMPKRDFQRTTLPGSPWERY